MSTNVHRPVEAPGACEYVQAVNEVTLPPAVAEVADEYDDVVGVRDRFLWKWIFGLFPAFTISTVAPEHRETARIQKTLLTIFITLCDDIAEQDGDVRAFEALREEVTGPRTGGHTAADDDVVAFGRDVWRAFDAELEAAPRREEFADLFEYDVRQALNSMDYSRMVNDNIEMANLAGVEHYTPHNMIMFPYADVDLMYSPSFSVADLGALREVVWELQSLARIGNWLTTWERELDEADFTAGVVVHALREGVISREDLAAARRGEADRVAERIKAAGVEERFMAEWNRRYRAIENRDLETESVDLDGYVRGMETVMEHHLASRGHK